MLIRVSGGSGGIGDYLAAGRKSGRTQRRDELDDRHVLQGSIDHLENILASFDQQGEFEKYLHITLSFKEKHLDEETLLTIDAEFRKFIFTACVQDEFYYYSEAHLPKIKSLIDIQGDVHERFPHIHVVIPLYNLYMGKRDNPLGKITSISHYINSFQELVNEKFQLESPKDNLRQLSSGREAILSRYELKPEMPIWEIKQKIFDLIREHPQITSVEELAVVVRAFGEVKVRDSASFGGKYINLALPGKAKGINLKDPVFTDAYLRSRDVTVTQSFVRPEHEANLTRWKEYAALQARFVGKAPLKDRQAYAAMDLPGKKKWLEARWQKHLKRISRDSGLIKDTQYERPASQQLEQPALSGGIAHAQTARSSFDDIPHMDDLPCMDDLPHFDDLPHMDDLPHFDDLPYPGYAAKEENINGYEHGFHGYNESGYPAGTQGSRGFDLYGVRVGCSDGSAGAREHPAPTHLLSGNQRPHLDGNQEIKTQELYALPSQARHSPARRVIDALNAQEDIRKSDWTQMISALDARTLLDYLQYHNDLNTENMRIERNKAGHDRIVADSRRYSASDFLTRYMHMTWPEAQRILRTVHDQQNNGEQRRQAVTSKLMWHRFQRYEKNLPGLSGVNAAYHLRRKEIREHLRYVAQTGDSKAQQVVKKRLLHSLREAEFMQAREEWQQARQYYLQSPHKRYLQWLHDEAEKGNNAALGELNRVYPLNLRDPAVFEIHIRGKRSLLPFSPVQMGYSIHVQRNGTVEYRDKDQKAIIVDTYNSIKVKDRSAEVIANALQLAKLRYGVNGFEIRNAREEDIAAIKAAVQRTQTQVRVVSTPKNTNPER